MVAAAFQPHPGPPQAQPNRIDLPVTRACDMYQRQKSLKRVALNTGRQTPTDSKGSGRNHEVDRLGAFALLVRFDIKCNTLSFAQIRQPG